MATTINQFELNPFESSGWQAFVGLGPILVEIARQAAIEKAISYRGFHVGAAALAVTANGDFGIFSAGNFKPYKDGPKQCAEHMVLEELREHKFAEVLGLFVTGPPQIDSGSGLDLPTLHPCTDCRDMLATDPLITDETLVTTVHPKYDWFEMYTRDELAEVHASDDGFDEPSVYNTHLDRGFAIWKNGVHAYNQWRKDPGSTEVPGIYSLQHVARLAATGQIAS